MIPKIRRGSRTHGLLAYLYGPGRRDEHTDPHLVGSWDGFAPDPGRDPQATLARLAAALDLRVKQAGAAAPAQHVWHCSVRAAPGDRLLTDDEWGTVAHRLVRAVGLAPDGDPDGCRWVAVRHADDHIHIVATMVRGDLRRPRLNYDYKKAQAECRVLEREMGLRQLNPGDGTAAKRPTSAERFKAERTGRPETARETLRDAVRQAVAGAATEHEFLTRLRQAGVRVKLRHAPSGDTLGYSVALPGDRNRDGTPIWYSGSALAPDLSLPKIRRRLAVGTTPHDGDRSSAARARRNATRVGEHIATTLHGDENDEKAAAELVSVGELLDAVAHTSSATTRQELHAAARAFERATRSHVRAASGGVRATRTAARGIIRAGAALGRGEDGATTAMLVSTLVLVATAAASWHAARGHAQQAAACRQAADHLRAAYHQAAAVPMRELQRVGLSLPKAERRRYEAAIRTVLPEHHHSRADAARHGREALLATLAHAERAGHEPEALLRKAIAMRELDTAENLNDVLVWRLRRLAHLPAGPADADDQSPRCTTTHPAQRNDAPRRYRRWA
ncbi:relaxase/mobilization nuclease domain-containing protein [Streptomyces sp. B6B3]|uniref:relaxase/mobilization nuclease domain-containing protein n=1 Tax=Streptomyces sp. B6B3 TaxID=3153570 RepID=UPI00325D8C50